MRKSLLPVLAALVMGSSVALGANTTFFTSIGDLVFPISPPQGANPGAIDNMTIGATTPRAGTFTTVTAAEVDAALGATVVNPARSATYNAYTFANNGTEMLFTPSGTVSYAYVVLAASPMNGQKECVFSTQAITLFYPTANAGQTILNATTTLAANARNCWTYQASNTSWYRSQ